ncbi:hypothetical protein D1872_262810 [compost metagenome]
MINDAEQDVEFLKRGFELALPRQVTGRYVAFFYANIAASTAYATAFVVNIVRSVHPRVRMLPQDIVNLRKPFVNRA